MFGLIVPSNSSRPTRRSHKKSRGGCLTCKERKLKCDEEKPVCGNCLRRFVDVQNCNYGQPSATGNVASLGSRSLGREQVSSKPKPSSNKLGIPDREKEPCSQVIFPKVLNAEMLDPFSTHPETKVPGVDLLMKYYLQKAVYRCFPWQPASKTNPTTEFYVPLVWSDQVLFHATLQVSAIRLGNEQSQNNNVNLIFLMAESIRLLRERIENSDSGDKVSDQTISAVATLAGIEHERGNIRMLGMHLDGLKRMVSVRGGLNAIRETNAMVSNSVFWVFAASIYELPYPSLDPILPPFFPAEHSLTATSHFQDIGPSYSDPPPLDLQILGVIHPIAGVINSIQHISQLVPTNSAYPTASTSLTILTRMCTLLSHLLSIPPITPALFTNTDTPSDSQLAYISESARFATLLHVFTPWRGLPPDGTLSINHLLHSLTPSLKNILSAPGYEPNILVLWLFATGGVGACQMLERKWFIGHLIQITMDMGIDSWEKMRDVVRRVIWHERLCAPGHKKLWEEVEAKRRELEAG